MAIFYFRYRNFMFHFDFRFKFSITDIRTFDCVCFGVWVQRFFEDMLLSHVCIIFHWKTKLAISTLINLLNIKTKFITLFFRAFIFQMMSQSKVSIIFIIFYFVFDVVNFAAQFPPFCFITKLWALKNVFNWFLSCNIYVFQSILL